MSQLTTTHLPVASIGASSRINKRLAWDADRIVRDARSRGTFRREAVNAPVEMFRHLEFALSDVSQFDLSSGLERSRVGSTQRAGSCKRDPGAYDCYSSPNYIQHRTDIGTSRDGLHNLIASLPREFKYEPGMIVAEGDLVWSSDPQQGHP